MSSPDPSRTSIDRLASQMFDAGLSEEQRAELLVGINDDPAACDRFVDHILLHATLRKELGAYRPTTLSESLFDTASSDFATSDRGLRPASIAKTPKSWRRDARLSLTCLAAGIAIAWVGMYVFGQFNSPAPQLARDTMSDATPVAYLAVSNGCYWGDEGLRPWAIGQGIQSGDEIRLYQGIAEFQLANGASLSLEGPVAVLLNSPSSLVLQHGKLTAHVPASVPDFKVYAGECRFTASEAEFGVVVNSEGIEVHAFSGSVSAIPSLFFASPNYDADVHEEFDPLTQGGEFDEITIPKGRALSLVGDADSLHGKPSWRAADETRFATRLTMSGSLPVSSKYIEAVMASRPAAYWRFESIEHGIVANEVRGSFDLEVVGKLQLTGANGNRVAEFGVPGSEGFLLSYGTFDALSGENYSVEFWLKPSHVHRGGVVALLQNPFGAESEGRGQRSFYLQLRGPADHPAGHLRFLHRDPPGQSFSAGTNCMATRACSLRRWQHVVAVKEGKQLRLHINGEPDGTATTPFTLSNDMHLVIGQGRQPKTLDQFVGQLDEVAVYSRALTNDEIKRHYKLIKKEFGRATVKQNSGI